MLHKQLNIYIDNLYMYSEIHMKEKREKREKEKKKSFWLELLEILPLFKFHWVFPPFS